MQVARLTCNHDDTGNPATPSHRKVAGLLCVVPEVTHAITARQSPHPPSTSCRPRPSLPPLPQVLAGFLRIVLEVINTVLAAGLQRNPELVYAVLHKQVPGGWWG